MPKYSIVISGFILASAAALAAESPREAYLADLQDRFLYVQQGWGELGNNECAHPAKQPAQPLIVGGKPYARGLGHHAPGEILVDLGGEYSRFESLVGVQTRRRRRQRAVQGVCGR